MPTKRTSTTSDLPIVNRDVLDRESNKGKRNNALVNTKRFVSIHKKTLLISFSCLFVIFLFTSGSNETKQSNKPVTQGEARKIIQEQVQREFAKLMGDVEDTATSESIVTTGWLHSAVLDAKKSIHRTLDNILRGNDVSEAQVNYFNEKVSNEVEKELQSELSQLVSGLVKNVQIKVNEMKNNIESPDAVDLKSIHSIFVEQMKDEIDDLEKKVEGKIHAVTKKVEKKLLKEKLDLDEDEEELELEEVDSVLNEEEDAIIAAANEEVSVLEEEMENAEASLEEDIKKTLRSFLKEKKISTSDAKGIEEEILGVLEDKIADVVADDVSLLEATLNEGLDDIEAEIGSEIDDDDNVADAVEKKFDVVKGEMEEEFKDITAEVKVDLINALREITREVESQVFEEKGIEVSDDELSSLVEKETKNLEKSAVATSV